MRFHAGKIQSLIVDDFYWTSGSNHASCCKDPQHQPPEPECECGFYADHELAGSHQVFKTLEELGAVSEPLLLVAVAGRGNVQVHANGWRSEEMQILALHRAVGKVLQEEFLDLQALYGIPLAESDQELERLTRGMARPADADLRPELPEDFEAEPELFLPF